MLASRSPAGVHQALDRSTMAVRSGTKDMMGGQYYMTPQIANQLNRIESGINLIRLDDSIMRSSKEWAGRFPHNEITRNTANAAASTGAVGSAMSEVKSQLKMDKVMNQQDNEVRELHQWAMGKLQDAQQTMSRESYGAKKRMDEFCDHIGVTDRYTGYRNNLTRGSRDPVTLGFSWLDTNRNKYNASLNTGWQSANPPQGQFTVGTQPSGVKSLQTVPRVGTSQAQRTKSYTTGDMHNLQPYYMSTAGKLASGPRSIQEQCGINTTFPGKTEYMKRYKPPPPDDNTKDYNINPRPDFSNLNGRPQMKMVWTPNHTEYHTQYEWPDSEKIVRLPWLRK